MLQTDNPDEILTKWKKEIKEDWEKLNPRVQKIKQLGNTSDKKLTIWLGGPGKNHELYCYRILLKRILKDHNFDVVLSEDLHGGPDIGSKELNEIYAFDIIFLLVITPGTSGEAIEFAHAPNIREKMWIFFPLDFSKGFIYRLLNGKHRLLSDESMFHLADVQSYSSVLVLKILDRAIQHRIDGIRKENMSGNERSLTPEGSPAILVAKIDTLLYKLDDFSIKLNSIDIGKRDIYEEIVFSVGIEYAGSGVTKKIHVNTQNISYTELKEDLQRYRAIGEKGQKEVGEIIVGKLKELIKTPEIEKAIKNRTDNEDIFLNP